MNIQGVHWAMDLISQSINTFSPLSNMFDMVLFPNNTNLTDRYDTKQMASLASTKHSMSSDHVLHSITKTHKKESISTSDQIPETIYTCCINQERELLIDIRFVPGKSKTFQTISTLLNSIANTTFIDKAVAEWLSLPLEELANPIWVFNVDGTHNTTGDRTHHGVPQP